MTKLDFPPPCVRVWDRVQRIDEFGRVLREWVVASTGHLVLPSVRSLESNGVNERTNDRHVGSIDRPWCAKIVVFPSLHALGGGRRRLDVRWVFFLPMSPGTVVWLRRLYANTRNHKQTQRLALNDLFCFDSFLFRLGGGGGKRIGPLLRNLGSRCRGNVVNTKQRVLFSTTVASMWLLLRKYPYRSACLELLWLPQVQTDEMSFQPSKRWQYREAL